VSDVAELWVRVRPRASANAIDGVREGALVVRVTAPPADGRANDAVRKLIARRLRVGVTRVEIVRGAGARDKLLRVHGVSESRLRAILRL
jgi:hypothetical protein